MTRHPHFLIVILTVMLTATFGLPQTGIAAPQVVAPALRINEFLADNDHVIHDEYGEYDDVIELYNAGQQAVDLSGMYLTDDPAKPTKFRVANGVTIEPGKFLLFWADSTPSQGIYHTNFSLSKSGESIGIFDTDANGNAAIDQYSFGPQTTDVSEGRCPDGGERWRLFTSPTIGASNGSCPRLFLPSIQKEARPPAPAPLPLRIDCGNSSPYTTTTGVGFMPDLAWNGNPGWGYIGGHADVPDDWWEGNPIAHTADPMLYKTQRQGWQEYRVSGIPNGDYSLTLGFEEQQAHGVGVHVFDLAVEGKTILDDLDVYRQVGRYYPLTRRFALSISDGELNLVATPVTGEPRLSFLELAPRKRDTAAPSAPTGLTATPSYGAMLLDWSDNAEDDLAGYDVYRTQLPDDASVKLTSGGLAAVSRFEDGTALPRTPYSYRVVAVDTYGNASSPSAGASGTSLATSDAHLPFYQLQVAPEDLAILNSNPWSDQRVPATFTNADSTIPAEVRYRGGIGRSVPKKSWKIRFPTVSPFPNQDRINVNANWPDPSLLRSKLVNGVFEAAGIRPPEAEFVLLALNGEYQGVYTRNEEIDEAYLARSGRNPGASAYKVGGRFAELLPSEDLYRAYYEKETNKDTDYADLISFIELINKTPNDAFARTISTAMDVEAFLDYYAVIILVADRDSATHNLFLVHDLAADKWEVVPYDLDASFLGAKSARIDMGTKTHPEPAGGWNLLTTRVLAVPSFRDYYCARLTKDLNTIFSYAVMAPKVDAAYAGVRQDGLRDWQKLEWEENARFQAEPEALKAFVRDRQEFLRAEMVQFCGAK